MKISDILGMSLTNLWRRKTRTFLTVLGVVIGTASIVVMLSLGIGLKQSMLEQVGTAGGLTEIMVSSDSDYGTDDLLLDDSTIETFLELEHVDAVEPELWYSMPIQAGKYESYITLIGVTREYLEKMELGEGNLPEEGGTLSMIAGNQILAEFMDSTTGEYPYYENEEMPNIDLLNTPLVGGIEVEDVTEDDTGDDMSSSDDTDFVDSTFSSSDTDDDSEDDSEDDSDSSLDAFSDTGDDFSSDDDFSIDEGLSLDDFGDESISYSNFSSSMKRVPIKITGITEGDIESYTEYSYNCYTSMDALKEFLKQNYSENSVIPGQPTNKDGKPYRDLKYSQLTVNVDESANVEDVLQTIQDMGYRGEANKEWLEEIEKEFMIIEAVLGGIGAVSLLVAAIGIANTMTMSTYERTKEIGIMKVLGCSLGNIRTMFLTEAAFIGLLGGMVGVALSFLLSFVVNKVAPAIMADFGEGAKISIIPFWLVLLSIVFSTIIGMIAGFFPAQRATKLSPLAAIRNE